MARVDAAMPSARLSSLSSGMTPDAISKPTAAASVDNQNSVVLYPGFIVKAKAAGKEYPAARDHAS